MPIRQSEGIWEGTLKNGQGKMRIGTSGFEVDYSFPSRFDNGIGTNPEELIGAAHAGCFSMALSLLIAKAGYTNNNIHTRAKVHLDQPDLVNALADGQRPKTMRSSGGGMTSQKVKLYSLSTCSHCKAVKNLLAKQDIAVDVVDVDRLEGDQRNQVLEKVKQVNDRVSFPTTVIGDDVIVGFKADRIKKTQQCGHSQRSRQLWRHDLPGGCGSLVRHRMRRILERGRGTMPWKGLSIFFPQLLNG